MNPHLSVSTNITRREGKPGFTIVELLVTVTILVALVLMLTSVFGSISSLWHLSSQKMDNFTKGRALINAMGRDLETMVVRQDLPAFPSGQFAFYTRQFRQTNTAADMRGLGYVNYATDGNYGITCTDSPYYFLESPSVPSWNVTLFGTSAPSAPTQPASQVVRPLCNGIYGFAYNFIRADGTCTNVFYDSTGNNPTRAVRVSLAILSEQANGILQNIGKQSQLASDLNVTTNGSTKAAWDTMLLSHAWPSQYAYPAPILYGIRTYERVVPLDFFLSRINQ